MFWFSDEGFGIQTEEKTDKTEQFWVNKTMRLLDE